MKMTNRFKIKDLRFKTYSTLHFGSWFLILGSCFLFFSCNNKPKEIVAENEFYVCSMDPQVMEKQMGMCPICKMPLAKTVIDKTQLHLIRLNDEQIRLGNIKTDTVKTGHIGDERTLSGVFTVNQNLLKQLPSRFNGRIEKLYFKIPGQEIKKGELIYEVYSRELMLAQEEYLFALEKSKLLSATANALCESAKNKLLLWGLTDDQIKKLEEDKEAKIINYIFSSSSGTITKIPYKEGDYISEGSTIFELADLSSLWVEAQVYSNELDLIIAGEKLMIIPEAFPEETIEGEIDFANPELQPSTKINLIRIKVPNEQKKFIPGMMAFVMLQSGSKTAITLPVDAIIQGGKNSHVWIRNKDGSFEARQVSLGTKTKSKIEIVSGLKNGDVAVISGAYLLYSDYVFKRGKYPLTEINSTKDGHQNH